MQICNSHANKRVFYINVWWLTRSGFSMPLPPLRASSVNISYTALRQSRYNIVIRKLNLLELESELKPSFLLKLEVPHT